MVFIIPNILVLHFGEILMKIRTRMPNLQMHENLHKNVNENIFMSFYVGQLKQQICYSFKLLISDMVFKMVVQFF